MRQLSRNNELMFDRRDSIGDERLGECCNPIRHRRILRFNSAGCSLDIVLIHNDSRFVCARIYGLNAPGSGLLYPLYLIVYADIFTSGQRKGERDTHRRS